MPNWNIQNIGSSLSLPAHGRAGARATSSLAAHFAKRNTKFGGGGTPEAIPLLRDATGQEARAGKNFYPVGSQSDSFGAFPPTFWGSSPTLKTMKKSLSRGQRFSHGSGGGTRTHDQVITFDPTVTNRNGLSHRLF